LLGPSASQRQVAHLKNEKGDRDDDDDRLGHEVVRLVRYAHAVNVFGHAARISRRLFSTIR
jgi:hypothetical protein